MAPADSIFKGIGVAVYVEVGSKVNVEVGWTGVSIGVKVIVGQGVCVWVTLIWITVVAVSDGVNVLEFTVVTLAVKLG